MGSSDKIIENLLADLVFATQPILEEDNSTADAAKLSGQEPEALSKKLPELQNILTAMGLQQVNDRLKIERGSFKLHSPPNHRDVDCVLFDLTKLSALVDGGYVVIDAEVERDGSHSFIILADGVEPDLDLPATDDVEAELVQPSVDAEEILKLAKKVAAEAIQAIKNSRLPVHKNNANDQA